MWNASLAFPIRFRISVSHFLSFPRTFSRYLNLCSGFILVSPTCHLHFVLNVLLINMFFLSGKNCCYHYVGSAFTKEWTEVWIFIALNFVRLRITPVSLSQVCTSNHARTFYSHVMSEIDCSIIAGTVVYISI